MGANLRLDDIVIPPLGESVDDGEVVRLHRTHGDEVKKDDLVLTIDTVKVAVDLFAPSSGTLNYVSKIGDVVRQGDVVAKVVVDLDASPDEPQSIADIPPLAHKVTPPLESPKKVHKAVWEGCKPIPKANPARRFYNDEDIRAIAQKLFDDTPPKKLVIPLDKCTDATISYFTAWAKRTVDQ